MTVVDRLVLSPEPSSARAARHFVSATLGDGDELSALAVLLVSELASNAIRHAGTEFEVCIQADSGRVRIDVGDRNPRMPTLRSYEVQSVSGRGLHMIAASANRWGFESTPTGKIVWFELDTAR